MANKIIWINDNEAQVTKAFEKKARVFGTEEYELWKAYRADFPAAKMVTKDIRKNPNKRTYKNLTYKNMETFIMLQEDRVTLLADFNRQKELARIQENPYRAVLAWFLEKFNDYDSYKSFFAEKMAEEPVALADYQRAS